MTNAGNGAPATAGWYAHPTMTNTRAYWDGAAWTEHIAPAVASQPSRVAESSESPYPLLVNGFLVGLLGVCTLWLGVAEGIAVVLIIGAGITGFGLIGVAVGVVRLGTQHRD